MPRDEDGVLYELTYWSRLKNEFPEYDIISCATRANDSTKQASPQKIYDDLTLLRPAIVVMQLGIVDCAPRLFGKKEAFLMRFLPSKLKNLIINFCSARRFWLTKNFPKVYVDIHTFKRNCDKLFESFQNLGSRVICISVAATSNENNTKSFNFDNNIVEYNKVLREQCHKSVAEYVDFYADTKTGQFLLGDGIHINAEGHGFLFDAIKPVIEAHIKQGLSG